LVSLACTGGNEPTFGAGGSHADYSDGGGNGDDGGTDSGDSGDGGTDTGDSGGDDSGSGDSGSGDGDSGNGDSGDGGSGDDGGDDTGDGLVGTGYEVGDVAYDLEDGSWSLHGLLGTPVVLLAGHMDTPTTVDTMEALGAVDDTFSELQTVAYIGRNEFQTASDADDAAGWESTYGIDKAVPDPYLNVVNLWSDSTSTKIYIIDSEMVIVWTNFGSTPESQLESKVDDLVF